MPTTESKLLDQEAVEELLTMIASGSLLLPLRVEGWHKSLTDGGWFIRNPSGRVVMTVEFVEAEKYLGKPALDGNAPARAIVALLNAIPALCATVKHLRAEIDALKLTEEEIKVLTDHHYYEAEKAITRRGDSASQRLHLERLAALRGMQVIWP